jgi:hypothetical protein
MRASSLPVALGLTLSLQRIQMTKERAQFTQFGRGRCPARGLLTLGELRNQHCIGGIGLVAEEPTLSIGCNPRWVDQADSVAGVVERLSNRIAVAAGGFQTRGNRTQMLFAEPVTTSS